MKIFNFTILTIIFFTAPAFAGEVNFYVYDSFGKSVVSVVDNSGAVVANYKYDSFGKVNTETGNVSNVYKFNGEQSDSATSLIYLRNRYYDPSTGRFITKDINRGLSNNPQTINPYPCCNNNPTSFIDSTGDFPVILIPAVIGAAYGAGSTLIGDLINSSMNGKLTLSSREKYIGNTVGGIVGAYAAAGAALVPFLAPGSGVIGGSVSGAISNATQQLLTPNHQFDWGAVGKEAGVGGIGGLVGGLASKGIPGLDPFDLSRAFGPNASTSLGTAFLSVHGVQQAATQFIEKVIGSDVEETIGSPNLYDSNSSRGGFGPTELWDASPSPSFGGVSLSKTATVLLNANIQDIGGATYDQATGQVILYGKTQQNITLPAMSLDDLAVAVSSEYGLHKPAADPGVSIGTEPSDIPGQMKVRYDGDTLNTSFGAVMFNADRYLKTLIMGKDNITGAPVTSSVSDYENMLNRYKDAGSAGIAAVQGNPTDRMWFTPKEISLVQSADGSAMEFDTTTMQLLTESTKNGVVGTDSYAEAFAAQVTKYYDDYASESPNHILQQLTRLGKITAVVKWIKKNDIPFDLSFFSNYVPAAGTTPQYTPQTSVTTSWTSGSNVYTLIITGGVIYKLDDTNFTSKINPVATAASDAAIDARKQVGETGFAWNFSDPNNSTDQYTAIAQSFTRSQKDGSVRGSKVDMSFPVAGDNSLALVRYYNSFYDKSTGFGYGWQITPFSIRFPGTPQSYTFGNNAFTVNANYQIYIREGQNEYLYTLLGLNNSNKPVYMREGGSYILTDNQDGTFTLNCLNQGQASFNSTGLLTNVTDRNGIAINYAYNGSNLLSITHQNGRAITLNYTGNMITSAIGPGSRTINYTYYPNGQLNTVVDPANQTTTYDYDTDLHIIQIIDPKSNTSYQAVYDDYNRATSQTAGSAQYSSNFNLADGMTTTTGPNNATTTKCFDENYHLVQSADFLNNTVNIAYDPNDLNIIFGPSAVTDANGQVTNYLYDNFGNAWYARDANGGQKFYFYDTNKNLVATRDELGNDTVYIYDANNRMTEELTVVTLDWTTPVTPTLPPSSFSYSYDPSYVTKYAYDSNGNLLSVTDGMSRTVNTTYDANGMPLTVTAPSGYKMIKTYDTLSRLSTVSDPGGDATSFTYDNADRITKIATTAGSVYYAYDANGNLETITDGNNNVTTYGYDNNNNLVTVKDASSGITQYTYDITNKLTKITMPNGAVRDLTYDEANRPIMEISEKTSPAPKIGVTVSAINFGSVPAGTPITNQLTVYNAGDASLNITNVSTNNTVFTVNPKTATIPAGGQVVFNVTLTALIGTNPTGNLTIQSNDPDTPSVVVSLSGTAVIPNLTTNVSSQLNGILVSWSQYQGGGTFGYYAVYRSASPITSLSGLTPLTTISNVATLSYVDNTTVIGTVYYYAVVAFDSGGTALSSIQSSSSITFLNFARIGLPVNIANSSNNEDDVAEVYNSTSNQFFVVYENDVSGNGSNIDIYGQFISASGQPVGSAFPVFNSGHIENKPQVAWNSTTNQYMVVCQYTNGSGVTKIEEQRVSVTGALVGSPVTISSLISVPDVAEVTPSIVYNSTENKYLIAYAGNYAGYGTNDLILIILAADGSFVTGKANPYSPYTIQNPKVVFNSQTDQYLVVSGYTNLSSTYRLAVFGISSAGTVTSGKLPGLSQKAYLPNVVYNPSLNQYAMVFQYDYLGNGTAYAVGVETISAAGVPASSFPSYGSGGSSYLGPSIAYNSTNNEYFITFTSSLTGSNEQDILSLRVSPSTLSQVITQTLDVASVSGKVSQNGVAAYDAANNEFFVAYQYNNGSNFDVLGQMVGVLTQDLTFTPSSLDFGSNLTQQLTTQMSGNTTGLSISVIFSADQPWIQWSLGAGYYGSTAPPSQTVLVNIANTSKLGVGSYSGNVVARFDGITTLIPVTMQIVTLPPNPPANPTPALGATNQANLGTPLEVSMTWTGSDPQSNPLTYNVYFSSNQTLVANLDPSVLVSQNQTASSYTSSALGYNQTYYWQVKAIDNAGLSALSGVWSFTTSPISVPTLIPYSPNLTNNQKPTLIWNTVNGAAHYNVQISNSSNFSSLLVNDSSSTSPTYTPAVALPQGTIYWRVAAIDSLSNEGSLSDSNSFVINLIPPAQVTLIAYTPDPTNNQKPTLTWNPSIGASLYHVQITGTSDFSTILFDGYVPGTSYTPVSNLPEGKTWWRVSAKDLTGNESPYSSPSSFTIDITPPGAMHITSAKGGLGNIKITWDAFNDISGDFHNFNIYRAESAITNVSEMTPINQSITDKTVTSFIDTTAVSGKTYYYAVTATDTAGNEYKQVTSFGPATVDRAPTLDWFGDAGYESGGLSPLSGSGTTVFTFKIKYTDLDGDVPTIHKVYIDINGDGNYSAFDMTTTGTDYVSGVIYSYTTTIQYSQTSQSHSYYFVFSDGLQSATANITQAISQATAIHKPDVFQTLSLTIDHAVWQLLNIAAGSEQFTNASNKIRVTNNGDGSQTYSLSITDQGGWTASADKNGADVNTFALSVIFAGDTDAGIDSTYFNEIGNDDVVLTSSTDRASSTRFGSTRLSQNGVSVPVGSVRSLWLDLKAPTKDTTTKGATHSVGVTINAEAS